jgi:hypothetical protein
MFSIRHFHPNNNSHSVVLTIECNEGSHLKLKVLNVEGKIAKSLETKIEAGYQDYALNVSDLSCGNYVLNAFYDGGFISSIKFSKE